MSNVVYIAEYRSRKASEAIEDLKRELVDSGISIGYIPVSEPRNIWERLMRGLCEPVDPNDAA